MPKPLQPVSVDGIEFDALITSSEKYSTQVPEYSVETGYSVSDTIILSPETLELTLFLSNRPVTWAARFGNNPNRVEQVKKQLKDLYFAKKLVTVTTANETYTNMAIESLELSKSENLSGAMQIPIQFKKVRVTELKTATIPDSYGKSGATAASAGTASTSSASSKSSGSSGSSSASSSGSSGSSGGSGGSGGSSSSKSGSVLYNLANNAGLL